MASLFLATIAVAFTTLFSKQTSLILVITYSFMMILKLLQRCLLSVYLLKGLWMILSVAGTSQMLEMSSTALMWHSLSSLLHTLRYFSSIILQNTGSCKLTITNGYIFSLSIKLNTKLTCPLTVPRQRVGLPLCWFVCAEQFLWGRLYHHRSRA